jgi:signal transduction histidine kinase/tetratricopeptide (TPR) repeat protein
MKPIYRYSLVLIAFVLLTINPINAQTVNRFTVDSLNDASFDLANSDYSSAFRIAKRSFHFAKKLGYINGQMTALCRMGRAINKSGDIDSSLYYFDRAEKLFYSKGKDSIFLAKTWIYMGLIYTKQGKSNEALEKYYDSYRIANSEKDEAIMGSCLINISNLLEAKGEYKKSLRFLNQALHHFSKSNYDELGSIHMNIGNLHEIQGRYKEAITAYKKANELFPKSKNDFSTAKCLMNIGNIYLHLGKINQALNYLNVASLISENNGYQEINAQVFQNKGEVFLLKKDLDSSLFYYLKSLAAKKECHIQTGQSISLERIGDIHFMKNQPEKALSYYLSSYALNNDLKSPLQLKEITYKLSNTYASISKEDSALFYLEISNKYQDKLLENMKASLIYEINYNKEKHKVAQLQSEIEKKELEIKKQQAVIWVFVSVILGSIICFYFMARLYKLLKKNKASQKQIDDLLHNQHEVTINAMIDGQENERTRIAGEVHDKLGGILSTVKLYFKSMDKEIDNLKAENIKQFEMANTLLDEACNEVRKIAHDLSTNLLAKMGLFAAVSDLKKTLEGSGEIAINLHTYGTDEPILALNELAIYRVIQEAVSNVLKHAKATEINIQLNVFDDIFNLIVEDNGVGFDVNQLIANSGMGLRGIEGRVKRMDGTFSIDSGKGKGTTINIDIPLKTVK